MVIDDLWFGYAAVTELRMCVSASVNNIHPLNHSVKKQLSVYITDICILRTTIYRGTKNLLTCTFSLVGHILFITV